MNELLKHISGLDVTLLSIILLLIGNFFIQWRVIQNKILNKIYTKKECHNVFYSKLEIYEHIIVKFENFDSRLELIEQYLKQIIDISVKK